MSWIAALTSGKLLCRISFPNHMSLVIGFACLKAQAKCANTEF